MFGIGGWELILIFAVILLLFGAKRLPEIARSLGKAANEFKKSKNEIMNYTKEAEPVENDDEQDK
ncbi:MAG TPA: twin-arginine translocase TatA/TatE family subunit [Victivallales bacterium]|nr:twin-arginine translocase TatA/TatE family subunit [Victivallales bacterium]